MSTSRSRRSSVSSKSRCTEVDIDESNEKLSSKRNDYRAQQFLVLGSMAAVLAVTFFAICWTLLVVHQSGVCDKQETTDEPTQLTQIHVTFYEFIYNIYHQTVNKVYFYFNEETTVNVNFNPVKEKKPNNTSKPAEKPEKIPLPRNPSTFSHVSTNFIPKGYDITLHFHSFAHNTPELPYFTVVGDAIIVFEPDTNGTNVITFNALDLQNMSATILNENVKIIDGPYAINASTGVYAVTLSATLIAGVEYKLQIKYATTTNNGQNGLYLRQFTSTKGHLDSLTASTQLAPYFARTLFPCFDETRYRASFHLTVIHPIGLKAISNAPIKSKLPATESTILTEFEPTPPILASMVALFIGDYKESEVATTSNGTVVQIHGRGEFMPDTAHVLAFAVRIIEHLQTFLESNYPFSRIDITPIVKYRNALKTWGMLMIDEKRVYLNKNYATSNDFEKSLLAVAHALSNQWLGNVVPPCNVTQNFVNDGLATFLSHYITLNIKQEAQNLNANYVTDVQHVAMDNDCIFEHKNNDTLESDTNSASSYIPSVQRSASIFNMLRGTIGDNAFFMAIRKYLGDNSYVHSNWKTFATAVQSTATSNFDYIEFLKTWFTVPGYPIVIVSRHGNQFSFQTAPFQLHRDSYANESVFSTTEWSVPVWYRNSKNLTNMEFVMLPPDNAVDFNVDSDDLLFVNPDNYGYYRVHYESDVLFDAVVKAVQKDKTGNLKGARLRLHSDIFHLLYAGYLSSSQFLKALEIIHKNPIPDDYTVFSLEMARLLDKIVGVPGYEGLTNRFKTIITDIAQNISLVSGVSEFESKTILKSAEKLKKVVQDIDCHTGINKCHEHALEQFIIGVYNVCKSRIQTANCVTVPVENRETVYCEAIKSGNKEYHDFIVQLWLRSRNPFEKRRLSKSLGCTKYASQIERTFNLTTTRNDYFCDASRVAVFTKLFHNNPSIVKNMFIDNAENIVKELPHLFVKFASRVFQVKDNGNELPDFLQDHPEIAASYGKLLHPLLTRNDIELRIRNEILPKLKSRKYVQASYTPPKRLKKPAYCTDWDIC